MLCSWLGLLIYALVIYWKEKNVLEWNENSSVGSMGLHVNFLPPFLHTYMVMNCSKHMTTKYSTVVCSSSSSTVIISNLYNII